MLSLRVFRVFCGSSCCIVTAEARTPGGFVNGPAILAGSKRSSIDTGALMREVNLPMSANAATPHPPRALVLVAFATVYLVWGSTYLAIRVAVETVPPFLMAGLRLLVAGSILFVLLQLRGSTRPTREQWRSAAISGFLMLVTGNGMVVWAEKTVPSGLAALLAGLVPIWFALLDWFRPRGTRPRPEAIIGILVGFAGLALLLSGRGPSAHSTPVNLWGAAALVLAGISWSAGSLYSKQHTKVASPFLNAAMQLLCGGVALVLLAWLTGEFKRVNWDGISSRSVAAFFYLVVMGSWVGFSAYVWILKVSKPSLVATYAYVNPVIALFLGNLVLHEPLNARVLLAAGIILAGVIIITLPKSAAAATDWSRRIFGAS